ncbi:MAG: adaptor protein MecA [Lachnospiraceae bacterium]|nr:adaptor protein MecA [Lachnospiraceae bacterium]
MKIEKVNDNQIRCTLTREDLASRQLQLSELAYGSEKAKNLFRDMMQQANFELGFEAANIPLMIEAIPLNTDSIVLIITKVEDPDELDTRFSRFTPNEMPEEYDEYDDDEEITDDEVIDMIKHYTQRPRSIESINHVNKEIALRTFKLESLSKAMDAAEVINNNFTGDSALYKDPKEGTFYLVLMKDGVSNEEFNRVCNTISEYGSLLRGDSAQDSYFKEHCTVMIPHNALSVLGVHKD